MNMDFNLIHQLICEIRGIGDIINNWRSIEGYRKVRDQKLFKTEADHKASFLLKELILKFDSNSSIISEEDSSFSKKKINKYWLIDPIDGTSSWYEGYNGFVTQISYIENETPILGIIYAPALNEIWWGVRGQGGFHNGKMLSKPQIDFTTKIKLIDNYPKPMGISKVLFEGLKFNIKYLESGSIGLKSVKIADGSANLFVKDVVFRDWDIAASYVLLKELDCHISDLYGNQIEFNGSHEKFDGLLVTSNYNLAYEVLKFIKIKRGSKIV